MSHITINEDFLQERNLELDEFLLLLLVYRGNNLPTLLNSVLNKKYATPITSYKLKLEDNIKTIIEEVLDQNKLVHEEIEDLDTLVSELQNLFPKGLKEGTNNPWRGSHAEIKNKLIKFQNKFNVQLNKEDCIKATKNYVSSFNGNYRIMHTLKYFILKQINIGGELEIKSELLSFLELLKEGEDTLYTHQEDFLSTLK